MAENTTSWNVTNENATSWNVTNENATSASGAGRGRPRFEMTTEDIVANVFFCVLAVMIVFGNSLVIGAFRVNRRLRTTTNLLLMSLAVADMLIGTILLPLWVYISVTYTYTGPVFNFYSIFDVICGVSSILNLTAISLERCYALLAPIKHRNIRKRVVLAIIFAAWVLATLAGTPREFLEFYGVIVTVVFFFVPLAIILGAYGTIFHIARAHARARGSSSFKKDLRIATTVAVVIGLFVFCWTPFFALNFAFSVCKLKEWAPPGCQGLLKLPQVVLKINKWLQYGNSICNPIIYGLRNKDFRRAFRKMLLGLCCKRVRIEDYSKSAYGRTVRSTHAQLQRDSSFENSRSVIYPPQMAPGMFDMRQSYRKAIQSGRSKPVKLKFTKKSLADGLLALNVDAFHSLAWGDFTSTTQLSSSSDVTASPAELCNPGFEYDQTETGIYPIDQATQEQDCNDNVSGSNNSLHKSSPKASMQNGKVRVHFKPSNSLEKDEEEPIKVSTLAPFDRKRSLSEIFIRPSSETDSLKQKLRSSFS